MAQGLPVCFILGTPPGALTNHGGLALDGRVGVFHASPDSTKNTIILPPGFLGLGYYSSPDLLKTYSTTLSKPSNNSLVRLEEETSEAPW